MIVDNCSIFAKYIYIYSQCLCASFVIHACARDKTWSIWSSHHHDWDCRVSIEKSSPIKMEGDNLPIVWESLPKPMFNSNHFKHSYMMLLVVYYIPWKNPIDHVYHFTPLYLKSNPTRNPWCHSCCLTLYLLMVVYVVSSPIQLHKSCKISLKSPITVANQPAQGQPREILHAALQWPHARPHHLACFFSNQRLEIRLDPWNVTKETIFQHQQHWFNIICTSLVCGSPSWLGIINLTCTQIVRKSTYT